MTKEEYYIRGSELVQLNFDKIYKLVEYSFIGFGILSALLIVLIFAICWCRHV